MVNRLLYRSRQRGFLEMDLLVGQFAARRLPQMTEPELVAFSTVLDQENPDLFKWLTGQEAPSDAMEKNNTFKELREHVQAQLAAHCAPDATSVPGKPWVRGWDDNDVAPTKAPQAGELVS
ncbi:hypothetical protein WJX81_000862 [Elliptochloris bilobata]|uniref:FAD assembly factor SdhE n=1 Tax=Elliptochloris bilobata TaxID=381761 RepID=A0AAW1RHQ0_9CHLO